MTRLSLKVVYLWHHVSSTAPPFILWWWNLEIVFAPLNRSYPFIGELRCQAIQMEHALIKQRGPKAQSILWDVCGQSRCTIQCTQCTLTPLPSFCRWIHNLSALAHPALVLNSSADCTPVHNVLLHPFLLFAGGSIICLHWPTQHWCSTAQQTVHLYTMYSYTPSFFCRWIHNLSALVHPALVLNFWADCTPVHNILLHPLLVFQVDP
jgi:hypothetical protein